MHPPGAWLLPKVWGRAGAGALLAKQPGRMTPACRFREEGKLDRAACCLPEAGAGPAGEGCSILARASPCCSQATWDGSVLAGER